ncbi:MAG: hypothetical protein ACKVX9_03315 [Blastocatellia bacterium]
MTRVYKFKITAIALAATLACALTIASDHSIGTANAQSIPPAVQQLINQAFQTVASIVINNANKIDQWKNEAIAAGKKTVSDFTSCPSPAAQTLYNDLKTRRPGLNQVIADATAADQQAVQARATCRNSVPNNAAFKTACDAAYNNLPFAGIKASAQAALVSVNAAIESLKALKCVSGCAKTASIIFPTVSVSPTAPKGANVTVCSQWEQGQFSFNSDSGNGELSASVEAKLPKCKQTKTYPLAACEWNLQTILSNLKLLQMVPPEVTVPKATLEIPNQSVQILNGLNQGACTQPFSVCKQISGSANFTFTLGADPVASLKNAMQSVSTSCTQQVTVGCLNPPFGLTPSYTTVQIPDVTKAKLTWTGGVGVKGGSITVDLTRFETGCTPKPLLFPSMPKISVGKQKVNFPFLCEQPQYSNVVANQ